MPKVKISGGRVFLLPSVPQEPQSHSVAQSERSSGAVLKQLIAKPSKNMRRNHLLVLQIL